MDYRQSTTILLVTTILILSVVLPGCLNGKPSVTGETWTFMIYMSDCDLETFAFFDINEMEFVGSGGNVNIVVQFDRWYSTSSADNISHGDWTTAKRFLVTKDYDLDSMSSDALVDLGEINSGDPQEIVDFVQWSMYYYPADHYFLDLWDHGNGIEGVCFEQSQYPVDKITLEELKTALATITNQGANKLDIVGFDACLMSTIEVANEVAPYAEYLVASEVTESALGWDYTFLDAVKTTSLSPSQVGKEIVDTFVAQSVYLPDQTFTLTLLDLRNITPVLDHIDMLGQSIVTAGSYELQSNILQIRRASQPIMLGQSSEAVDLYDFIQRLQRESGDASIRDISGSLLTSLDAFIIYFDKYTGTDDIDVSNAHGLSIYSPEFSAIFNQETEYESLSFKEDSQWDEALQEYYTETTPEQIIYFVEESLLYDVTDDDGDGWADSFWIACEIASLQDNAQGYLSIDIYDDLGYLLDFTDFTFTISSDELLYIDIGDFGYSLVPGDEPGYYQMAIYLCLGTEYNPDYFQDYAETGYEWLELYTGY